MRTRYLTHLMAAFNPFSPVAAHRTPRVILSNLGPNAYRPDGTKISTTILPADSPLPARMSLTFKSGQVLEFVEAKTEGLQKEVETGKVLDLRKWGIKDVEGEVDRIGRVLARKEELAG